MTETDNGGYAVLFVDDEEKALKYFAKAFDGRFTVYTASDVDEAEDILNSKSDEIAVVISDQRMPGKNGVELLKKIRKQYPSIVRVLTTAYSDLNEAIEAINRGEIYRYITKPWKVESLQAEVAGAMDYFLLRRERDLLLAEKLSTRQRMAGIDRITQLIVFAQTVDGIHHADYALKNFLEYLHGLPGVWESDGLGYVDQWESTKCETKRIIDYIHCVTGNLLADPAMAAGFSDSMTVALLAELATQVAAESCFQLDVIKEDRVLEDRVLEESVLKAETTSWNTNTALLANLFRNVFALFERIQGSPEPSLTITEEGTVNPEYRLLNLAFQANGPRWPEDRHLLRGSALTDVHPVYQQLLTCALATAHHGGSCALDLNSDYLKVTIRLPMTTAPAVMAMPELGWEWLPEVLSHYEPDIDEFYHDL